MRPAAVEPAAVAMVVVAAMARPAAVAVMAPPLAAQARLRRLDTARPQGRTGRAVIAPWGWVRHTARPRRRAVRAVAIAP
jgi:hypothetical protein